MWILLCAGGVKNLFQQAPFHAITRLAVDDNT